MERYDDQNYFYTLQPLNFNLIVFQELNIQESHKKYMLSPQLLFIFITTLR